MLYYTCDLIGSGPEVLPAKPRLPILLCHLAVGCVGESNMSTLWQRVAQLHILVLSQYHLPPVCPFPP